MWLKILLFLLKNFRQNYLETSVQFADMVRRIKDARIQFLSFISKSKMKNTQNCLMQSISIQICASAKLVEKAGAQTFFIKIGFFLLLMFSCYDACLQCIRNCSNFTSSGQVIHFKSHHSFIFIT